MKVWIVARAFFRRGLQEALSYRFAFALRLVLAAVSLSAFFYFARFVDSARLTALHRYGGDYLSFGLVGVILLNLQHTVVSAYPQVIRNAQLAGTLEAMLATPTPGWLVLLCAPLYRFVASFISAVALLAVGGLLFGVRFTQANGASLALALPLCVLAFASLGLFGAALTMVLRRADPISLILGGVSALAGGVFYPTQVLPGWLRGLGHMLPITHALELVRQATFAGTDLQQLGASLAGLGLFCVIATPLGLLAFTWAVRRARRDGSLSHY